MDITELSKQCKSRLEKPTYDDFIKALKAWSCCPNLSELNALLTYEQLGKNPQHLKTKEEWNCLGIHIKTGSKPVQIWVPKMEKNSKTGLMERKGAELQERYDISQTNAIYKHPDIETITIMLIKHYGIKLINDPSLSKNDIRFSITGTEKKITFNKELYKTECLKNADKKTELLKATLRIIYNSREANVLTDMLSLKYANVFPGFTSLYLHFNFGDFQAVPGKDFWNSYKKEYNSLNSQVIKLQNYYNKKSQLKIEEHPYIPTQTERDTVVMDFLQRVAMDSDDPKFKTEALSILQQFYLNKTQDVDEEKTIDEAISH